MIDSGHDRCNSPVLRVISTFKISVSLSFTVTFIKQILYIVR